LTNLPARLDEKLDGAAAARPHPAGLRPFPFSR